MKKFLALKYKSVHAFDTIDEYRQMCEKRFEIYDEDLEGWITYSTEIVPVDDRPVTVRAFKPMIDEYGPPVNGPDVKVEPAEDDCDRTVTITAPARVWAAAAQEDGYIFDDDYELARVSDLENPSWYQSSSGM